LGGPFLRPPPQLLVTALPLINGIALGGSVLVAESDSDARIGLMVEAAVHETNGDRARVDAIALVLSVLVAGSESELVIVLVVVDAVDDAKTGAETRRREAVFQQFQLWSDALDASASLGTGSEQRAEQRAKHVMSPSEKTGYLA